MVREPFFFFALEHFSFRNKLHSFIKHNVFSPVVIGEHIVFSTALLCTSPFFRIQNFRTKGALVIAFYNLSYEKKIFSKFWKSLI